MSVMSAPRMMLLTAVVLVATSLLPASAPAAPSERLAGTLAESFVIKSDGTLWSWGGNAYGYLGVGDSQPRAIPVQVGTATDWTGVAPYSFAGMVGLRADGSLWRWGYPGPASPVPFGAEPEWGGPWQHVAAGGETAPFLFLLTPDGQLWAYGDNGSGQLGDGTTTAVGPIPKRIGTDLWLSVAAGWSHGLGVKSDGSLWSWGGNAHGQLGLGDTSGRLVATRIGDAADWAAVFAAQNSSYALTTGGELYAWGENVCGKLGIGSASGDRLTPTLVPAPGSGIGWRDVAPGVLHCVALADDGSLWGCGYDFDGELGFVSHENVTSMVRIGTAHHWAAAAAGVYHTIALTENDEFAACGGNAYGQLGLGFSVFRPSPEQVGSTAGWLQVDASLSHAAGVRDDHSLWTWGYDIDGGLGGVGSGGGSVNAPARVGYDDDWASVSCGAYNDSNYTMAVKQDGTLWAFGDNGAGQLGLGDVQDRPYPTQVGSDTDWVAVAASDGVGSRGRIIQGDPYTLDDHTLAVKSDGSLWAWGANDYGQLGIGDTAARLSPTRVDMATDWAAVACGDDYSAALKTDGSLWVWGHNWSGQLGTTDLVDKHVPTRVTTGGGSDFFRAFACGSGRDASHMLAVKTDGTLWGWGGDRIGELLHPGQTLPPTRLADGTDWKSVACGSSYGDDFSLATTAPGELWTWGGNYRGQLGNGDFVAVLTWPGTPSSSGWDRVVSGSDAFGLKTDGTLWAWGDNTFGQLGLGDMSAYPSTTVHPLQDYVDTSPPSVSGTVNTTPATGPGGAGRGAAKGSGGWTRTPRTIAVKATDSGSGVGRAQISLTGGVSYVTRTSAKVRNGDVDVYVRAIDRVGNVSLPRHLGHWKIDTTRPRPAALGASVRRGSVATIRYRIADYSPCAVRIAVLDARGATVKYIKVRHVQPMSWVEAGFRCTLARGTYRFVVAATDSVGYGSRRPGAGTLIVR